MAKQRIRSEWYHEGVGRGYMVQVWDSHNISDENDKYDVEFAYGGRYICTLSIGCYGHESAKYWYDYWVEQMERFIYLTHSIDAAEKTDINLTNMLRKWIKEMAYGYRENITEALVKEFEYYLR